MRTNLAEAQATQTLSFDFDDAVSVGSSFTYNPDNATTGQTLVASPTGGVGNSGKVLTGWSFFTSAVYNAPIPNSAGKAITLAASFKTKAAGFAGNNGDVAGLGIYGAPTYRTGYTAAEPSLIIDVTVNDYSNSNSTAFGFRRPSSSASGYGSVTPLLQGDHWYRLSVTFLNTGSDWDVSAQLYDVGADGLAAQSLVTSFSIPAFGDPDGLAGLSQLYVGMYPGTGGGDVTGTTGMDNFTVTYTPPPTPLLAVGSTTEVMAPAIVNLGTSSKTVTLYNNGSASLTVSSLGFSGGNADQFSVTTGTCPSLTPTLAAGASCTLLATFVPTSLTPTTKSTSLNIVSNGGSKSIAFSGITGTSSTIPTLSEWGMIAFAVLLVGTMVLGLRRRDEAS